MGFESFWVGDHIALPAAPAPGATRRRGDLLPQRPPVLLAEQRSTIDVLSKGRLIVGIGVG